MQSINYRKKDIMKKLLQLYERYHEAFSYVIFGGLTTVLNLVVFYTLNELIGMNYLFANLISIVISILFAYVVNKKYVFRVKSQSVKQVSRELLLFFLFRSGSLLVDMLAMVIMVEKLALDPNASKLITEIFVVVLNFIVSKFIVFKNKSEY